MGSHPHAELHDRPIAARLKQDIEQALLAMEGSGAARPTVQILTDLWFLNDPALVASPAVAFGTAQTNAAVAHFASRLPQAMVVDGTFEILLDRTAGDPRVALRGVDADSTALAVSVFVEKYLRGWIEEAARAIKAARHDPQCL